MVLAEIGQKITQALQKISAKSILQEDDVKDLLNEIARALLQGDVNIALVKTLQDDVKAALLQAEDGAGLNKRKILQNAVIRGLTRLLNPGVAAFQPAKGKPSVVLFVGLQGAGKTTSCTKYAAYFQRKGLKVGVVCADTFRAGAYDQLRQNAAKMNIRFYGSLTEADAVRIAKEGVEALRKENFDLVVVDTSGRHRQEEALLEEMKHLETAIRPNDIVFVMSATDGQAVKDQARNFKEKVKVGSVILTKMDCHAKGGGALSAVAATQSPIVFIGTGEHFTDFEIFKPENFVRKMLGMGDFSALMDTMRDAKIDEDNAISKRFQDGQFTLRDLHETLQKLLNMGSVGKVIDMIPGMAGIAQSSGHQNEAMLKRFIHIMDSMNDAELEDPKVKKIMTPSRMHRIARGSGTSILEVHQLVSTHAFFDEFVKKIGKKNLKSMTQDSSSLMGNPMAQLSKMFDPNMMRQMGNIEGIQNMMRQLTGEGGIPGAGRGGIPNMANMMKMAQKVKFKR
ncbi:unnamed protein product [Phytomonas sp. Hart1]|nr:unnamed protein product [Phytomonas sp. Hart1]|eukprot:CCW66060.1 unnamed protein product [Phytomonas sp. isolate Hart1]